MKATNSNTTQTETKLNMTNQTENMINLKCNCCGNIAQYPDMDFRGRIGDYRIDECQACFDKSEKPHFMLGGDYPDL